MPVSSTLYPMNRPKETNMAHHPPRDTSRPADFMEYYIEPLSGARAQLHVDTVLDGALVPALSHPVGSPAPIDTVRPHARRVILRPLPR